MALPTSACVVLWITISPSGKAREPRAKFWLPTRGGAGGPSQTEATGAGLAWSMPSLHMPGTMPGRRGGARCRRLGALNPRTSECRVAASCNAAGPATLLRPRWSAATAEQGAEPLDALRAMRSQSLPAVPQCPAPLPSQSPAWPLRGGAKLSLQLSLLQLVLLDVPPLARGSGAASASADLSGNGAAAGSVAVGVAGTVAGTLLGRRRPFFASGVAGLPSQPWMDHWLAFLCNEARGGVVIAHSAGVGLPAPVHGHWLSFSEGGRWGCRGRPMASGHPPPRMGA